MLDAKRKGTLQAGAFARWVEQYVRSQLQPEAAGETPCGECNACCKGSYYVAIAADERETIARIPRVHLTLSTQTHEPQWALDQSCTGSCPMLVDESCSIYAHRPQTCRRYDCRVFAAVSVSAGQERPAVNSQVWRWRFDYPSEDDQALQTAVLAAAAFLQRRNDLIDADLADSGALARAAVSVYEIFLDPNIMQVEDEQLAAAMNHKLRAT